MPEKRLLIDTDIFILLAGSDLIELAIDALGFTIEEARRLPAIEYQITRGKSFLEKYSEHTRQKVLQWAEQIQPIDIAPKNQKTLERLLATEKIDGGEGNMLALLLEQNTWMMSSADNSCLRALGDQQLADLKNKIEGRIASLETVLFHLNKSMPFQKIAESIVPVREYSTILRVAFSRGSETDLNTCLDTLQKYIIDLEEHVGTNFLLKPRG